MKQKVSRITPFEGTQKNTIFWLAVSILSFFAGSCLLLSRFSSEKWNSQSKNRIFVVYFWLAEFLIIKNYWKLVSWQIKVRCNPFKNWLLTDATLYCKFPVNSKYSCLSKTTSLRDFISQNNIIKNKKTQFR
jgi:hypothetical protein